MNLAPRLLASLLALTALRAQDWRPEPIVGVGIEIDAPSRLERLPMQLGEDGLYHRARWRPKDNQDFVRAQYYWYCDVYEFAKKPKEGAGLPEGLSPEVLEQLKKLLENSDFKPKTSFKQWLDAREHKPIVEVAGKQKKGRSGKLDFTHWVWQEKSGFGPCGIEHCEAAVYSFEDREVALVVEMPRETERGALKSKWKNIIDHMIASGRKLDAETGDADAGDKRDKYADTPEKKEALAAAKANIAGLQGWDYFTQPNYIVIYSWDFEKADERSKSKKDAEFYASRLERMRELYLTNYPLDPTGLKAVMPDAKTIPSLTGPTTGAPAKPPDAPKPAEGESPEEPEVPRDRTPRKPYSVFRLCAAYDQFQKYGQSPPGVIGWYSPRSKELVVFLGGGADKLETVVYHEGWHQYADFYFGHPDTKGDDDLHRWFDEGHGDYFGSFRWGTNGWKYVGSKMRYPACRQMVASGAYVPFKDIVHWDRRRFYGNNAADYYAQAFSMIDFLRRGAKSQGWDARWAGVLDMYRQVMLVEGDSKLASDTAFFKFTSDDWNALEEAWKTWVKSPSFMSGQ